MKTFADRVIAFNRNLDYTGTLPRGIRVMNPFRENPEILPIAEAFYRKYYSDTRPRRLILGINPGRLGAGATGIPFTDTKRLAEVCRIPAPDFNTHEPSSVFVYALIDAFGGPEAFYGRYYINSVCPLGFVRQGANGRWVNYNYYDDTALFEAVRPFILENLQKQIDLGVDPSCCYSLGKKNARYLEDLNQEGRFFRQVVALDHPRYIVQYKSKELKSYVGRYLDALL
ncbi:MAG TPA: SMUG2 DNA glycosylase family protein [Robiginitalea sp.]|nr:SMUG2 DNA glycosylase family protein [Robiginitalea sp.]